MSTLGFLRSGVPRSTLVSGKVEIFFRSLRPRFAAQGCGGGTVWGCWAGLKKFMWAGGYVFSGVPRSSLTSHKAAGAIGSCMETREGGTSGMVGQVSKNVSN